MRTALACVGAQFTGAVLGAVIANVLFGLRAFQLAEHARSSAASGHRRSSQPSERNALRAEVKRLSSILDRDLLLATTLV